MPDIKRDTGEENAKKHGVPGLALPSERKRPNPELRRIRKLSPSAPDVTHYRQLLGFRFECPLASSIKAFVECGILREPATDDFYWEQNRVQLAGYIKVELFIPMLKPLWRMRYQAA